MRTVDIICGVLAWGFGGAFLLYVTGFFTHWMRFCRNPGDKPRTGYDFDKNPPKSLFTEPPKIKASSREEERVVRGKHMGEDVEWVMTRHAHELPENQPLYKEFFVKRGSRWVKQKWRR